MASNQDEDFGLNAYQNILEDLEQWGEATPVSTPRYSSGSRRHYDDTTPTITTPATPASVRRQSRGANDDDVMEEEDAFSPSSLRSPNVGAVRRDTVGI